MFGWKKIGLILIVLAVFMVGISQISFSQEAEETAKEKEAKAMTLWQTCVAGGWTMIFIGLCSVLATWLIIEYLIKLDAKKIIPDNLVKKIYDLLQQRQHNELMDFCKKSPGLLTNMVIAALDKMAQGAEKIQQAIAESAEREQARLQYKIYYLSIIATIAPMLGLLGTVLGMIQAFNVIAFQAGLGKPTLLAEGVAKALITTAAGLIVAIPAMAFYFFFRNRISQILERAEDIMTTFMEILLAEGEQK